RNSRHFCHFANELVPWRAVKRVIPTQNLHVRVANPRQPHADQRPARAQLRDLFLDWLEAIFRNAKRQHFANGLHWRAVATAATSAGSCSGKTVRKSINRHSSSMRAITGVPSAGKRKRDSSALAE